MAEIKLLFISSRMHRAAKPVQDLSRYAKQHLKVIAQ